MTKSAFADLCGVSPGRVSQWIAAGQITGAALVGEGRSARIHVETARAQLRHRLDVGRRLGNGMGTRLASAPAGDPPLPTATPPPGATAPATPTAPTLPRSDYLDPVEERIKAEKLDEIARRNRIAAQREAADSGRYIEAAAARREMGLIADGILQLVEQSLATFATAIAERFQVPQRDVLHLLRAEARGMRERAAAALTRQAAERPRLVEDTTAGPDDDAPDEPGAAAP